MVPIPIEIVMAPMMIADRARNWTFAAVVFLGCLVGSLIMYAIGLFAFESVGRWLIDAFAWQPAHDAFQAFMDERGVFAVALISITPIPLVIAAIGAGASQMNVLAFLAVLGLTRAIRYFGIALLVHLLGPRAERLLLVYQESVRVRYAFWAVTLVGIGLLGWSAFGSLTGHSGVGAI